MKFFASSITLLAVTCFIPSCLSDDTISRWALTSIDEVKKAAASGNANAQLYIGQCYYHGRRVACDLSAAAFWFHKAADQGDAEAQRNLGSCYSKGQGVEKDLVEAVKWIRKAAEQGDPAAQCDLGVCYFLGEGVAANATEAVKWYRRAAVQEYAVAQFNLGGCYTDGKGVDKDYAEAVKWYRKAAEQGVARAQYNLGVFYECGYGVAQDYTEAVKWYRKSAEQGNTKAENSLGGCYAKGQGVPQNLVEAYKWLNLAATQGDQTAKQDLAEIEQKMTSGQLTEAQRSPTSLSLISWEEEPVSQEKPALELTLETSRSVVESSEGIAFTICFHNSSVSNLLLNGGALLSNGTQIWSSLEAELKSERGQRIPLTFVGGSVEGRAYCLGVPLRAGGCYKLPVGVDDYLVGSGGRLKPGKYEIRCVYNGRQSPYRDSTQKPVCWEGRAQSNSLRVKVLRSNLLFRVWDIIR